MNVWAALPRSIASTCRRVPFFVGESSSTAIRHFSNNTRGDSSNHLSELVKEALEKADSQLPAQHSPPRLPSSSDSLTLTLFKGSRRKKNKKAASKDEAETMSTKEPTQSIPKKKAKRGKPKRGTRSSKPGVQQLATRVGHHTSKPSQKPLNETPPFPSDTDLEVTHSTFATESWSAEPWATTSNLHAHIMEV